MKPDNHERRLTTILAADVVGFSRLMGADESGTLSALQAHRKELIEPKSQLYGGRTVKLMGDGTLMEFASVVDAVLFAVEVQCAMREHNAELPEDRRIVYRIGINIGDIIVEGDDIYGDGVNIAARLEGLSEPGGICVSSNVFNQVKNKIEVGFEDLGDQQVKNIQEPVRIYKVTTGPCERLPGDLAIVASATACATEKPAIAVLPFDNMSGDAEQEYFADGITEDLITELARFQNLVVIARNSGHRPELDLHLQRQGHQGQGRGPRPGRSLCGRGLRAQSGQPGPRDRAADRFQVGKARLGGALRSGTDRYLRNPGPGDTGDRRRASVPTGGGGRRADKTQAPAGPSGLRLRLAQQDPAPPRHQGGEQRSPAGPQ
jgi:class 3 adenylate cyclase